MRLILTVILTTLFIHSHAQIWPKIYGESVDQGGYHIHEVYDQGYIISGDFISNSYGYMGFVMKTNINGDILWEKHIGESDYRFPITSSYHTSDGGMIISSFTTKFDAMGDSYIQNT